ncbi:RHS repeat-associated core domain-containing protein [Amycolatopsis jiangsuensis]|uniref:RHS repeat-associated protein n=1 Tax=Amycolatopsis jiangsuensis TaxID=1181879 RepID=A0A840J6H8_9PSEU|nr:RHS repeat-associated core domain-containing protein [Amycolatopsis jiangsuensis]MBB4689393.1 RHS repeat-associated protein [Amycolatopsis jiangsuensis]
MSNPLVAQPKETSAVAGVPLLEDATGLKDAIESKNWAAVAIGAVGTALDVLTAVMDPFGAIFAAGVGWLMEHVGPLKEALDALTGNADEIQAQAETWTNVAKELEAVSIELTELVKKDLQDWKGDAADAYRTRADDTSKLIASAQKGSEGAASGVQTAGEVVAAVRSLVRDTIADLVGHLISWALQVVFTLGIGMTWVVPQVVSAVAKTASKITEVTTKLVKALKALMPLLKKAGTLFEDAGKALKKIQGGKGGPGGTPKDIKTEPGGGKSRSNPDEDNGSTHTAGAEDGHQGGGSNNTRSTSDNNHQGSEDQGGGGSQGGQGEAGHGNGSRGTDDTEAQGIRGQGKNDRSPGQERCETDPVVVSTGQMVMEEVDATLLGVLPLVFRRTHLSGYRAGLSLGGAWVSTVDQRIEADEHGVSFAAEDGTLQRYPVPGPDSWVLAESGPHRPLKRVPDGGYFIEDSGRGLLLYFAPGAERSLLARVTDRQDNAFEIVRAEDGTPREIRHTAGHRLRLETRDGLVTALFAVSGDGEAEVVRYGYADRNLVSVTNPSGQAMQYRYDGTGRIVGWTDRNGEWFRYQYDQNGRVVRTEGSGGFLDCVLEYDPENRITRSTDALGHTTEFHFSEAGQLLREINPLGQETALEWDARDNLLSSTDPLGRTTRYRYDEAGNLTAQIRPGGAERRWERDEAGRAVAVHEAPGVVTRYEYDQRGNVTKVVAPDGATTGYRYGGQGALVAVTDPVGGVTTLVNDPAGLVVAVTGPRGGVTRFARDEFGRVVAVTDPVGGVERFGYTTDGRLAWHQTPDGGQERWALDGEGNDRVHLSAAGTITRRDYGGFDLPVAQVRPDGSRLAFTYDLQLRPETVTTEQGQVWRYEWDAAGNLIRETDFTGGVTTFGYDAAGRLVERVSPDGQRTTFRYDPAGNLAEQRTGDLSTRFEFSGTGHLLSVDDGTTRVSYERDAVGRVVAETVNGRTVRSAYDAEGRLVHRVTPSGAESSWQYDAAGLPVAARLAGRDLRFVHDPLGREVRRTLGTGATLLQTWTPGSQLASQEITDHFSATHQQRSYGYRADGELVTLQDRLGGPRRFDLDPLGRVTEVRSAQGPESYRYDTTGNVTEASWPTAETDLVGRRTFAGSLVTEAGGMRYAHDRRGRVVLRERTMPGGAKLTWRFTWTDENRLVAVVVPDGSSWRYTYDALGRRVAKEHFALDGHTSLERVEFTWDGPALVEEARDTPVGRQVTVWDYAPGNEHRPLAQRGRTARPGQDWVDTRFHAIVTDLAGRPAELVDDDGRIIWCGRTSVYGAPAGPGSAEATPLRFPGQYFDAETGLHYNLQRYYDPVTARYLSLDPIGLEAGPNPYAYVDNPFGEMDPLGLTPGSCKDKPKLKLDTQLGNNPVMQSGGGKYSQSPNGSWYKEGPPGGKNKGKSNRVSSGMNNPSWTRIAGMPERYEKALSNPQDMPSGLTQKQKNDWMQKHGEFHTVHQDGTPDRSGVPKKDAIMGHNKSAGDHWNYPGHKQSIPENKHYNSQSSSYGQIEYGPTSSGTGSQENPYRQPRPDINSYGGYTNPAHPDYTGGPWSSWSHDPNGLPPDSHAVHPPDKPGEEWTRIPQAPTDERFPDLPFSRDDSVPDHTPPGSPTGPPAKRPRLG